MTTMLIGLVGYAILGVAIGLAMGTSYSERGD
jgi:hypothetical protein